MRTAVLTRGRPRVLLAGIVVLGLALRFWGISWGLQDANVSRRAHPDEWAVYWLFHWFDRTHSLNPCPRSPGQCFFDWGSGFPYLAYAVRAVISPVLSILPAGAFGSHADLGYVHTILAARLTSAALSTATIVLAFLLASEMFGEGAGLVTALLVSLSALLIQLAHFATPDSATGFFLALALLCIIRAFKHPSSGRFALAGATAGLATGTEYHMILLAAPLGAAWLQTASRDWRKLGLAATCAAATFLILNPYILLEPAAFLESVSHTLRTRTIDSGLQYGDRWAAYDPSWLYVIRYALGYGVGAALTVWLIVGLVWSLVRHTRLDHVLLAWMAPYVLLVTLEPAKFMRYSAPLIVPLAVLGGRLAVEISRGIRLRAAVAVAAALVLAYTFIYDGAYVGLFATPDPRAVASSWLATYAGTDATVAYEELPDGLLNLPYFVPSAVRPCFAQYDPSRLSGFDFVALDSYAPEEQDATQLASIRRFDETLASASTFRVALSVHNVPSFLGLDFPIDASPHDWRYPDRQITVYRRVEGQAKAGPYCFATLAQATTALYVPAALRSP